MNAHSILKTLAISTVAVTLAVSFTQAQQPAPTPAKEYEPQRGQSGKDVIWIPTPDTLVEKMLDMAKVTKDDTVIDLGSGDGRTVIAAAKRGARAVGIEYNPDMVEFAKKEATKAGATNATFVHGDIFQTDFTNASVLTLFLLTDLNLRLRPVILDKMKPGTRVVSNTFNMGDWTPEETIPPPTGCQTYCTAYFWIVPAKVEGKWTIPNGELNLTQKYQMLTGTLKTGTTETPVSGKMLGNDINLTAGSATYTGTLSGNNLTLKSGANEIRATKS
jgi:SAM-dependent methyltransferase